MQSMHRPLVSLCCAVLLLGCSDTAPTPPDLRPPPIPGGPLRLPVEDPAALISNFVIGVDHNDPPDPAPVRCRSYLGTGFPACYSGHEGTDFPLDGGFAAMDAGSAFVVAAAAGVVAETEDDNYDRCHGDVTTGGVDCDGHPMRPNRVVIDHDGGLRTVYLHLMKGSILVRPGQRVACGERLGRIGSSGRSALPHIHLTLYDNGALRDPYAGPASQPRPYWNSQPADPVEFPSTACAASP